MYIHVFTYSTSYTYRTCVYIYIHTNIHVFLSSHMCIAPKTATKVLSHITIYFTLINESFHKCVGSRKLGNEIGAIPCTSAPRWNSRCNTARVAQCADCHWRQPGTCMFTKYVYISKDFIRNMNSYIYVYLCVHIYVCVHICVYRWTYIYIYICGYISMYV